MGGHLPKAPSQETGVRAQVGVVRGAFQAEGTARAKAQRRDSRCAGETWSGELGRSGEAGGRCGLPGCSKEPGFPAGQQNAPDEIQCVGRNGVVRVRVSTLVLEAGVMCGLGDAARRADKVVEAAAGGGAQVGLFPGYELPVPSVPNS